VFDACICIDPEDACQLLRRTTRTARKRHECGECRQPIEPGQQYQEDATVFEGKFAVYKTCLVCVRIRDSLFSCGWYYGSMWSDIHEEFCGEDETGNPECICPESLASGD